MSTTVEERLPAHATVLHGDCADVLGAMPECSFDAVVTDPPYGLADLTPCKTINTVTRWTQGERGFTPHGRGFDGASWDRFVPPPAVWEEILRVLKPGATAAVFAGARTLDLMGLSVRLAGFVVEDLAVWARSDTFAKAKGRLKSQHEPILILRKPGPPLSLNVDAVRIPHRSEADLAESVAKNAHDRYGTRHGGNHVYGDFTREEVRHDYVGSAGRTPGNLILSKAVAEHMSAAYPHTRSRVGSPRTVAHHGQVLHTTRTGAEHDDVGGPDRFFRIVADESAVPPYVYAGRAPAKERPTSPDGTTHHTVKPLAVMDWLVSSVASPGQRILDPFAGSGTTLESAVRAGVHAVGIEREEAYLPLIAQRLARASEH